MEYLKATDFEILRGVPVSGLKRTLVEREPVRIATIIDEEKFKDSGNLLAHNKSVFLEDKVHDWTWKDGELRYYTRIAKDAADILVVYAVEKVVPAIEQILVLNGKVNFHPMTGERIEQSPPMTFGGPEQLV